MSVGAVLVSTDSHGKGVDFRVPEMILLAEFRKTAPSPSRCTILCSGIHQSKGTSVKAACTDSLAHGCKFADDGHPGFSFPAECFQMFSICQYAIQSDSKMFGMWFIVVWLTTEGDI